MSYPQFYAQLDATLRADAGLQAWMAATAPGKTWATIEGNRTVARIQAQDIPGIGYELQDSALKTEASARTEVAATLGVFFIWSEEDHDASFQQRLSLLEPLVQALMANGTLNDAVGWVSVEAMVPDRNVFHPKHVVKFDITGVWQIAPA